MQGDTALSFKQFAIQPVLWAHIADASQKYPDHLLKGPPLWEGFMYTIVYQNNLKFDNLHVLMLTIIHLSQFINLALAKLSPSKLLQLFLQKILLLQVCLSWLKKKNNIRLERNVVRW